MPTRDEMAQSAANNLAARIAGNKAARDSAKAIVGLIVEQLQQLDPKSHEHFVNPIFWAVLPYLELTVDKLDQLPMTDKQAREFGQKTIMPYGEFRGKAVDEVDLERLQWYVDNEGQAFTTKLKRYLKSKRLQAEGVVFGGVDDE